VDRRRRRRAILNTWYMLIVNNAVTKAESGSQKLDQRTHPLVSPADWYRPTDRSTTIKTQKCHSCYFLHHRESERERERETHTHTHTHKRKWKTMIRCWRWDQCVEWQREIQHQKDLRERCLYPFACTKRENSETWRNQTRAGKSEMLSLGCLVHLI
jgi:hypothetical protein